MKKALDVVCFTNLNVRKVYDEGGAVLQWHPGDGRRVNSYSLYCG